MEKKRYRKVQVCKFHTVSSFAKSIKMFRSTSFNDIQLNEPDRYVVSSQALLSALHSFFEGSQNVHVKLFFGKIPKLTLLLLRRNASFGPSIN